MKNTKTKDREKRVRISRRRRRRKEEKKSKLSEVQKSYLLLPHLFASSSQVTGSIY